MAGSSVYALGLKGFIELRRASKPPRVRITKISKSLPGHEVVMAGSWGYRLWVPARRQTIQVIDFIGGRFLKSLKRRRSKGFPKVGLGKVQELPPETAARLLG